ncbi:MAG: hypothetical protein ACKO13_04935 [Cytophagales bacterium]
MRHDVSNFIFIFITCIAAFSQRIRKDFDLGGASLIKADELTVFLAVMAK